MSPANSRARRSGFTLVELLIIAPIALLVITGFVALMVTMVGDIIATRTSNVMTYDVQSALSSIERDVRLSTAFLTTSGTLPSPQGKDGGTDAFISNDNSSTPIRDDLILGSIATNKNPLDSTRKFVYYANAPNACNADTAYQNRIFFTTVIYTVRDNSLWRRTYVPAAAGAFCDQPWQVNTCAPGNGGNPQCQANDEEILKGVKNFNIEYFVNPEDTIPVSAASAPTALSIRVTIDAERTAAGRAVSVSSSSRSTKLTEREVNLAPPSVPVVTGSNSGTDAVFNWPSVPTATAYIIKYNVNGSGWQTVSESSTETTFSLPANHGDTISIQVAARNTAGASAAGSASVSIPLWIDCALENGWVTYSASYAPCGFTKTKDGVVVLQGLIKDGSLGTTNLFRLPEAYRPSTNLIFTTIMTGTSGTARVQVTPNGYVTVVSGTGSSAGYLSLSGIQFVPGSGAPWTNIALLNGWQNYNAAYSSTAWADLSSFRDPSGRVHVRGLVKQGTFTSGTPIGQLPADSRPSDYYHFANHSGPSTPGQTTLFGIDTSGNIAARGVSSDTYYSVQTMFYPASHTGWTNFTQVSGAPAVGQIGNSWTAYAAGYPTPGYTKSEDGIVTVRGLIKGGAQGAVVAILPTGYHPTNRIMTTTTSSGNGYARIDVTAAGQIVAVTANTSWTSISISFRASN